MEKPVQMRLKYWMGWITQHYLTYLVTLAPGFEFRTVILLVRFEIAVCSIIFPICGKEIDL